MIAATAFSPGRSISRCSCAAASAPGGEQRRDRLVGEAGTSNSPLITPRQIASRSAGSRRPSLPEQTARVPLDFPSPSLCQMSNSAADVEPTEGDLVERLVQDRVLDDSWDKSQPAPGSSQAMMHLSPCMSLTADDRLDDISSTVSVLEPGSSCGR